MVFSYNFQSIYCLLLLILIICDQSFIDQPSSLVLFLLEGNTKLANSQTFSF